MSCSWPVDRTCLPNLEGDENVARQREAEDLAVSVLWALSGRQFGTCPVIVRPCPEPCNVTPYGAAYNASTLVAWTGSNWANISCGCLGGRCTYHAPSIVHLAAADTLPIHEISEVRIADEVMSPSEYTLEGSLLYRNGGAAWPKQDLTRPLPETGTWSVTYTRGVPVPGGVAPLVGTLALEFLNACTTGKCTLPRRVRSVTRQGVSFDMVDPTDIYREGRTGIPQIDQWIAAVNPNGLASGPRVR